MSQRAFGTQSRGRRRAPVSIAFLALVLVSGCEPAIPRINTASPVFSRLPPEEVVDLQRGRREYIAKCSGCHVLYGPRRGDAAYWTRWTAAMAERAKTTPGENERIIRYLVVAASIDGAE